MKEDEPEKQQRKAKKVTDKNFRQQTIFWFSCLKMFPRMVHCDGICVLKFTLNFQLID